MSSHKPLREFICERLSAAAEEICKYFEGTIARYEEELDRQRKLLNTCMKPRIQLDAGDIPRHYLIGDENPCDQERDCSVKREELEPQPIKGEEEEFCISQDAELPVLKEETTMTTVTAEGEKEDSNLNVDSEELLTQNVGVTCCQDQEEYPLTKQEESMDQDQTTSERTHADSLAMLETLLQTEANGLMVHEMTVAETSSPSKKNYPHKKSRRNFIASQALPKKSRIRKEYLSCIVCKKTFCDASSFAEHFRTHTGEKPFLCNACGKCFGRKTHLTSHMKTHTEEKPFQCKKCGKNFRRRYHLLTHMRYHTGEKPFPCEVCGRCFTEQSHLLAHIRIHTGEKPFACKNCGKCFRQKHNLTTHMKTHMGEEPFPRTGCDASTHVHKKTRIKKEYLCCIVCRKSFSDTFTFAEHFRLHTGERPFVCRECGKDFRRKMHLTSHMKIHSEEKPFPCEECGKSFRRKYQLLTHTRTHTGEKPFACTECGKCFSERSYVLIHMQTHTGEKPFPCEECGKNFRRKHQLVAHMKTHT